MEQMDLRYLFPFEKVKRGSRIIIYGAGTLGRAYLKQLVMTKYVEVVAIIDRAAEKCPPLVVPVLPPEKISDLKFSYVVIALRGKIGYREMERILLENSVKKEQIVFEGERSLAAIDVCCANSVNDIRGEGAFKGSKISLAFNLIGGLGDLLIQKKLLVEIFHLLPNAKLDLYTRCSSNFLSVIYHDCENVNKIFTNFGDEYVKLMDNYALAMSIVGSGYVKVDYFSKKEFEENRDFIERIERLQIITDNESVGFNIPHALMFWQRIYKGQNAYTGFCYDGLFDIQDKLISVPDDPKGVKIFDSLKLRKYITINFGNGESQNSAIIAKSWTRERFETLTKLIKKKYPLNVVQIGEKGSEIIKGSDKQFLGEDFGVVAQILKHAILHIDIEGGMTHFASQLGTKCAVLFGPTPVAYYAYEGNINIQAGKCHDCYGLYLDVNKCARNMEEPECMYSITPTIVMEYIKEYLEKVIYQ